MGRFAEQLADADLEGAVQVRHPSLTAFDQLHVVEVGVADEGVTLEIHTAEALKIQHLTTTGSPQTAEACCLAAEKLLKSGAALVAYDTLAEGLKQFPADARLRQLTALALARTGASRRANEMLSELAREGHADEETFGLLASTHKDLAADALDDHERRDHLNRAFESYRDAHNLSRGYYSGINAATMALLLGARDDAAALARGVRQQCIDLRNEDPNRGDIYWILATLGEAALVLQDWPE